MKRVNRNILLLMGSTAVVSCNKTSSGPENDQDAPTADSSKPNVILIVADDMGYGDISAMNENSKIMTPNIDALCSEGIIFTNAHSASSMSTPSRYSILTGRYPWRTGLKSGVLNSKAPAMISEGRATLGTLFQNRGYNTAAIGKWHLGWGWDMSGENINYNAPISDGPTDRGFDYFYGITASLDMPPYVYIENDRVTQVPTRTLEARTGLQMMRAGDASEEFIPEECFPRLTDKAIDYIEKSRDSENPFFLYLPLTAPHTPVLPSADFKGKSPIGAYGDFVMMIDDAVKRMVFSLKRTGQYNNTIIIFTADNGCAHYVGTAKMEEQGHFPSYIWRGYKSDLYEGGHRIPLIISWPGKTFGQRSGDLVCLTDFYATFADMLGSSVRNNEAEDSFSFYDVLTGAGYGQRKDVTVTSNDGSFALTSGNLKFLFTGTSGGWSSPASGSDASGLPKMQVYNLSTDATESKNLYGSGTEDREISAAKSTLRGYILNGRSNQGLPVSNDTGNDWKQIKDIMEE